MCREGLALSTEYDDPIGSIERGNWKTLQLEKGSSVQSGA